MHPRTASLLVLDSLHQISYTAVLLRIGTLSLIVLIYSTHRQNKRACKRLGDSEYIRLSLLPSLEPFILIMTTPQRFAGINLIGWAGIEDYAMKRDYATMKDYADDIDTLLVFVILRV